MNIFIVSVWSYYELGCCEHSCTSLAHVDMGFLSFRVNIKVYNCYIKMFQIIFPSGKTNYFWRVLVVSYPCQSLVFSIFSVLSDLVDV